MPTVPPPIQHTVDAIYRYYEQQAAKEPGRTYLGWSEIGHPCERALWYKFRMTGSKGFDGRMLRLFDTGHREEDRVLQELRAIGCEVWSRDPQTGKQFGCESLGGHLRGHLDAVVKGLPEAPKTPHLVDVKTCNVKKFAEVQREGMRKVYPKYWAQAQGYMGQFGLTRGMYIFVCKDNDQIHTERFEFDEEAYTALLEKARRVIFADSPPGRISDDAAWHECRFCDYHATCHGTQAPQVTCRSCLHSTPQLDGKWTCSQHKKALTIDEQWRACGDHRYIPAVLHWAVAIDADAAENWVRYRLKSGGEFTNGQHPQGVESHEIAASTDKAMLAALNDDEGLREMRQMFDARLVK